MPTGSSALVVIPGLEDHDVIAVDQVLEAMLLVEPSRPAALQNVFQLLGLADPRQRNSSRRWAFAGTRSRQAVSQSAS
jgi:hypothetical protein